VITGMACSGALISTFVISRDPSHSLLLFRERRVAHFREKMSSGFASQYCHRGAATKDCDISAFRCAEGEGQVAIALRIHRHAVDA